MTDRLRLVTLNVLSLADPFGRERQEVVRRSGPELRPDIIALQEVTRSPDLDQAPYLLGLDFTIVDAGHSLAAGSQQGGHFIGAAPGHCSMLATSAPLVSTECLAELDPCSGRRPASGDSVA